MGCLGEVYLLSLQTLRSALHDKGDLGAFIEGPVAGRLNSGEMHEDILAILTRQKAKTLCGVEPLYCSCFFHVVLFSNDCYVAMEVLDGG